MFCKKKKGHDNDDQIRFQNQLLEFIIIWGTLRINILFLPRIITTYDILNGINEIKAENWAVKSQETDSQPNGNKLTRRRVGVLISRNVKEVFETVRSGCLRCIYMNVLLCEISQLNYIPLSSFFAENGNNCNICYVVLNHFILLLFRIMLGVASL